MNIDETRAFIRTLNEFKAPYALSYYTKINGEFVTRRGIDYGARRHSYLHFWRDINRQHALEHGGKPIARPSMFYQPVEDLNGSNTPVS